MTPVAQLRARAQAIVAGRVATRTALVNQLVGEGYDRAAAGAAVKDLITLGRLVLQPRGTGYVLAATGAPRETPDAQR